MRAFLKNFVGMILACATLLGISFLLHTGISCLFTILSSKKDSVNTSNVKNTVTVVLDAGHGGIDGGAVGVSGILEKDLNLAIVLKTQALLEENGYAVILTRESDELLSDGGEGSKKQQDLRARVDTVEKLENAIFISVHMNRFPDSAVKGITFYYSPNHPDSYRLAECIHLEMLEDVQPDNRRPMKEASSSIYILHHTTAPAVLVECGFISNALEEAKLADEAYQYALAVMISDGVIDFLNTSEDSQ